MFLILKSDLHLTDCFYSLNVNRGTEKRLLYKHRGRPQDFCRFWISAVMISLAYRMAVMKSKGESQHSRDAIA